MATGPAADRGFNLPLSPARRIVGDLLHFARRIPTVPVQRAFDLRRVIGARDRAAVRVGWVALFTKAYALVAAETPVLRRAYFPLPRPRLYQHPFSVASVAVERQYAGEYGVYFANLPRPEAMPLAELDAALRRFKSAPVPEAFRFTLGFSRLPTPLRRLAWWYLLNVRAAQKATFMGTFGVTVYSGLGAESLHPLSPLTTTLNYGVIGPDGVAPVRIVYDHRVMDGATVARALVRLDEVLNAEVADELERVGRA